VRASVSSIFRAPQVLLGLRQARLEVGDRLGSLALEALGHLCEPALESLRTYIADLREALAEHGLRLARERLDGAVELARQPCRRRLARPAHGVGELLRGSVGVARRRALQDAVELLDLLALHFGEARLDAAHRLRLLALDQLGHLPFAAADALVQLV
jgi:hypothetical protein